MMAMRLKAQMRPINVYMAEKQPEVLARHVLLLAIFFDNDLGPRECTEMFLEVYGNSMLRKQTSAYVHAKVEELVSFLTNGTGLLAGLIDVSSLKFKERDALEKVLGATGECEGMHAEVFGRNASGHDKQARRDIDTSVRC
jgi:dynein assembly factor 3